MNKIILIAAIVMATGASKAPYNINVPSDPKGVFTVLDIGKKGDLVTITTKRVGSSGTAYSQRAYDCNMRKVMYLGSGETLEQMKSSKPDDHLSPIFEGSIADYVGREACG